MYIIY